MVRNVGIIAHIDAWKTTTTERILYYTGKNHKIWEVHDGAATMDWMAQEQERGITITSAATTCQRWDNHINIIDTPWHVDFTIEVERSLKVLDGAVTVLSSSDAVQPQTETVWRQADKYNVPRLLFVNKIDKVWADFNLCVESVQTRLSKNGIAIHLPHGQSWDFKWVVSLVNMKYYTFEWSNGETQIEHEIPAEMLAPAQAAREKLLDAISSFDDELAELFLMWEEISTEMVKKAIRIWVCANKLYPIMVWSALRNAWVQLMLDAMVDFLPSPLDIGAVKWYDVDDHAIEIYRKPDDAEPVSALAFKIMTDPFVGKLTFVRVYSGIVKSWDKLINPRTWNEERVWRLLLMHANKREEIEQVHAWHICAFLWLKDVRTGDTLSDIKNEVLLEPMNFPKPVISLAVEPVSKKDQEKMWQWLTKLAEEDPSFRFFTDEETGQTIIEWMWELHLEILVDRLKREHKVEVQTGKPQVAYRETITGNAEGEGKFVRQSWGRGQYGHVWLKLASWTDEKWEKNFNFIDEIVWWVVPREFIPAIAKWCDEMMRNWVLAWYPIINVEARAFDGSYHDVDSSEVAFKIATFRAFKEAFMKSNPMLLEPIMKVEVVTPEQYVWDVMGDLSSRRGIIQWQEQRFGAIVIDALVPLSEMFGYTTSLRSSTQGRASSSMEFSSYERVPTQVSEKIIAERAGKRKWSDDD